MRPETVASVVDGGIPILGGIYGMLLGYRVIGKRPGESAAYDQWHERFGASLKMLGPLLVAFGLFQIVRSLVAAP